MAMRVHQCTRPEGMNLQGLRAYRALLFARGLAGLLDDCHHLVKWRVSAAVLGRRCLCDVFPFAFHKDVAP
jgi:hypothetical protein